MRPAAQPGPVPCRPGIHEDNIGRTGHYTDVGTSEWSVNVAVCLYMTPFKLKGFSFHFIFFFGRGGELG